MSTPVKLTAFAAVLAVLFVLALAAGSVVGPIDTGPAPHAHEGS